jgi:tRNA G18 (ribose-2'-O)-methylase SpoU
MSPDRPNPQTAAPPPTPPRRPLRLVLDNIRSAFNVGSIFRTADACAAGPIHLCGMTAHPPHPRLTRTALGAESAVPWSYHKTTAEAFDLLEAERIPIVAIEVAEGAVPYFDYAWPPTVALVLGHETRGIAPDLLERTTAIVTLPMFGAKNTLNVASVAAVVMYEVLRQWGALSEPPTPPPGAFSPP